MPEGLILWGVKSIYYVLENITKNIYKCLIKGKIIDTDFKIKGRIETSPIVVGDKVIFEKINDKEGLILERLPRHNEFKRLKSGGRVVQTIFANVDYLIIVDSIAHPPLRPYFIDRCLFTAEYMKIPVIIVFNKIDLLSEDLLHEFNIIKSTYEELNYKVIETSCITYQGIDKLKDIIKDKISTFNGRSGVGKSSLIKAIDPQYNDIKTGNINKKYDRGVHTTTFSKIYTLNSGSMIIDTPGIRELSIYIDKNDDVAKYIRDFIPFRDKCRFHDCQHINEPGCAVLKALEDKNIKYFRYDSYTRIRDTVEKLVDSKI